MKKNMRSRKSRKSREFQMIRKEIIKTRDRLRLIGKRLRKLQKSKAS